MSLPVPGETPASRSGEAPLTSTLDDAMRAPSTNPPGAVVLDKVPKGLVKKEHLDPKEDLWLTTADARYSSDIIPLRVGEKPHQETFYVHKNILLKSEYFRIALCGDFQESQAQSIDLPEENPATFHFLVAYLYEERYVPIKPLFAALDPELEKGKGKATIVPETASSVSDSTDSGTSNFSAMDRRRRERRRRRAERHAERMLQKHPGLHRPSCQCPRCITDGGQGPPCWHCSAPRLAPPPMPPTPPDRNINIVGDLERAAGRHRGRRPNPHMPPAPPARRTPPGPDGGTRIRGEDMRTWLLAYELNLDVYILANKFLLDGFKREVSRACVDMLETAGTDAARPEVLRLCAKLYFGLPEADPLLRMVFARVGFLQPDLWRRAPGPTAEFLVANPEIAAMLLRETGLRRESEFGPGPSRERQLPSMERLTLPPPPGAYLYNRDPGMRDGPGWIDAMHMGGRQIVMQPQGWR